MSRLDETLQDEPRSSGRSPEVNSLDATPADEMEREAASQKVVTGRTKSTPPGWTSLGGWFGRRSGLALLVQILGQRRIRESALTYYFGGAVGFLFLLGVTSGILLLLPYRPDPATAHGSVASIVGRLPYGNLIRGVHVWSSHLFVLALMLHVFSSLMLRRFTPPRELVWLSGLVLLVFGVSLAFTGVILPWSQQAYLQARISSEMVGQTPLFGPWLRTFLRGGQEVSTWSLHHAYGFHIGVLPAATSIVLALHLLLGMPNPAQPSDSPQQHRHIPLYPDFVVRLGALWAGVLALVISLATFAPQPLGEAANLSLDTPAEAAPPWYLLFLHQLLRAAPASLLGLESAKFIIGALGLVALGFVFLPFIDRRGSRATLSVGVGLLALYLLLTVYALI